MQNKLNELLGIPNVPPEELRTKRDKIDWDLIFLREALLWSEKSHDAETQCGCVLVKDQTPLSTGYNGFVRGIDDSVLPNIRPHKYPFMIHAELNAVLNCARQGKSTLGATAYITTTPCFQCLQLLWQAGITHIVYSNLSVSANYGSQEEANKISGLMLLINRGATQGGGRNLTMKFIDKNDVLPKK